MKTRAITSVELPACGQMFEKVTQCSPFISNELHDAALLCFLFLLTKALNNLDIIIVRPGTVQQILQQITALVFIHRYHSFN